MQGGWLHWNLPPPEKILYQTLIRPLLMTYLFHLLKVYQVRRGRAAHYYFYVIILLRHHLLYIITQLEIIIN